MPGLSREEALAKPLTASRGGFASLSVSPVRALDKAGISTYGDAVNCGRAGLLDINGVSDGTVKAIARWLKYYDIELPE